MRRLLLILLCLLAVPVAATAGTWNPIDVMGFSVGLDERWLSGPDQKTTNDFQAMGNAWFSLTHHVSITGGLVYGFESSYVAGSVDARLTATDVYDDHFNVWVGAGRYFADEPTDGLNEWAGKAGLGWLLPVKFPLIAGLTVGHGLDTYQNSVTVSLVYPFKLSKEASR